MRSVRIAGLRGDVGGAAAVFRTAADEIVEESIQRAASGISRFAVCDLADRPLRNPGIAGNLRPTARHSLAEAPNNKIDTRFSFGFHKAQDNP